MKLIYKGTYDGNPENLPCGKHQPNAVKFKEFENTKEAGIFVNIVGCVLMIILILVFGVRSGIENFNTWGCLLAILTLFPHEILHAICFKEEVYLYTNWKQGMLFVVGPEVMSKSRFIFMSLLPNLVFGLIPFIVYLIYPNLYLLGVFGAITIGMGAGDYYNVFNALTQMPGGAKTYLYHFNFYWFMPESHFDV